MALLNVSDDVLLCLPTRILGARCMSDMHARCVSDMHARCVSNACPALPSDMDPWGQYKIDTTVRVNMRAIQSDD